MKMIKPFAALLALPIVLFFSGAHLTACQKQIIYDTIIKKDTIRIADTIRITDTCNCNNNTLKEGLVAYYNFNNGNLKDSSGKNNHIVNSTNATLAADRFGRANNAYYFNGTSSFMRVNDNISLNPDSITIMATIRIDGFYNGLCKTTQIMEKGFNDQRNGIYGLRAQEIANKDCYKPIDVNKQTVYGFYGNTQTNFSTAYDVNSYSKLGEWRTYVYTYDGKTARFYIDGELKSVVVQTAAFTKNADDLYIGRGEDPQYPYFFNGIIDEIRIYKRPICGEEVKLLQQRNN